MLSDLAGRKDNSQSPTQDRIPTTYEYLVDTVRGTYTCELMHSDAKTLVAKLRQMLHRLAAAGAIVWFVASAAAYDPTWESLDQRTAPSWFLEEKFYIFVHWGLFSVPHYAPLGKLAEWYKQELMQPDVARGNTSSAAFHARVYGDAAFR